MAKIVDASTIMPLICYMVDMTTKDTIYNLPNLGCLLGSAYHAEEARLAAALAKAEINISPAEYVILRILFAHGEMQQCEISRIICKDKASVSRNVKSLVSKELATARQISYKCSMVSLTDKGESLETRLLDIAETLQNGLSERISAQQMDNLREILEKIIN